MNINVTKAQQLKEKPDWNDLGFGKYYTDHMFTMDYTTEKGWHNGAIVPFGPVPMNPVALVLHYAQEVFEGMKAYRAKDGRVLLFRPEMNGKRMARSCDRLCMPELPVDMFIQAVNDLVAFEKDWIPKLPGTSLYVRPFMFACNPDIAPHIGSAYKFMIVLTPVGTYYKEGINPVKIYVEEEYTRAARGGTGFTKCGGNYAASLIAQKKAEKEGFTQVLWLDGVERKYVEEVGTMNVMFKIGGEIWTAPLDGNILPGVTRDSCLKILRDWGLTVREEPLAIDALMEAGKTGALEEAFGTGTAAIISPIGSLRYKGDTITVNDFKTGALTKKLYDYLTGIQYGDIPDPYGWVYEVKG